MHPIENILQTSMSEIRDMVDVSTIVGEAIVTPDGSTVVPISKVSFGFVTGGGEYGESKSSDGRTADKSGIKGEQNEYPFAGGASSAVSIQPTAFLILKDQTWKLLSMDHKNTYEKIIDVVPQLILEVRNAFRGDNG